MKDGFIKVAAASVDVHVADPFYNKQNIMIQVNKAYHCGAKLLILPELCMTAYSCGDLFWQGSLLKESLHQLGEILGETQDMDMLIFIGMPLVVTHKLYNCAVACHKGKILGVVPKKNLPNYAEFYEARHFSPGGKEVKTITLLGQEVPFGTNILFCCDNMQELVVGCEICEDLWVPLPPSSYHALAGATVICNLSASNEVAGKGDRRKNLVVGQSEKLVCAYLYVSAGEGESTGDLVFGGHNMIVESGTLLSESKRFGNEIIYGDIDLQRLEADRRKMSTYLTDDEVELDYVRVHFDLELCDTELSRSFEKNPFMPTDPAEITKQCEEMMTIAAMGLKKRLSHVGCKHPVLGLSGGLDSTLAALTCAYAMDMLGLSRDNMLFVTMPCFGTTDRTYENAKLLANRLGATLKEVPIAKSVLAHFEDIGQDPDKHDVTFENAQARERTQVLMDLANQINGMVIGTGDMSELALGWATYNGDHMSMYAVNASVTKTQVRSLVRHYAMNTEDTALKEVLLDILNTPVSPELLPPKDGEISQVTEDLVGPYELHDFFLYYMLRFGFRPTKTFRIAQIAFDGAYDDATIYKWLRNFFWRFFVQQYKRSCVPDGPKVGQLGLSPRGDLRLPSDASSALWMRELDELKEKLGL